VAWVAIARLGAVEVPRSPALRGESLAYPLREIGVRLVMSGGRHVSTLSHVVERNEPKLGLALIDDDFVPDSVGSRHCLMRDVPGRATAREGVGPPS